MAVLEMLNGSASSFLDGLMATLTSGFTWMPLYLSLLYLVINNSDNMTKIGLVVGAAMLCVVLSGGVCDYIVKPIVGRLRPVNDPMLYGLIHGVSGVASNDYSFFSSHSANTMSLAVFFSMLVKNRKLFIALLVWSLTNCYTRLYLGMHYPSDVLVGIIWGAVIGFVVFYLYSKVYYKVFPDVEYISTQYTPNGYTIATVDIVILVIILTYIYAILHALIIS